jgi:16S rRNA (adenine1518-N6/adenine1519-N6)-dimethyltransferase
MTNARQTVSFLTNRFREAGIRPDVRHGQNFLIDLNLLDLLLETAEIGPQDVVLEIGTGLGSLTTKMAPLAAHVVTVEIDSRLYQLASEELVDARNVTMLKTDALKNKNHLSQTVVDTVQEKLRDVPGAQLKLVSNLPYNIATPILSNLLTFDPVPVSMTATVQKELADRINAQPGVKDYSALSVWMQALCYTRVVRIIPPQCFWPKPKVHSAIVHIVPNAHKREQVKNLEFFHHFIRTLFQHRRKFLRGVLVSMFKDQLSKPDVDAILAGFDLPADARAEQLPVATLIGLSDACEQGVSPGR